MSARMLLSGLIILTTVCSLSACDGDRSNTSFVDEVESAPTLYYRVEASYEVRDTLEVIGFDFVVACGGQITTWTYSSPSVSISWFPNFVAQPTEDGAAIGIRVPKLCEDWAWGEDWRTNERDTRYLNPPVDFLPSTIWYPDVGFLGFGIGYESDIAYESDFSKLKFLGANVQRATASEWRNWRNRAEADYKQIGALPGPWGYSLYGEDPTLDEEVVRRNKGMRIAADTCNSVVALNMTEKAREAISGLIPSDRKRFWTPPLGQQSELFEIFRTSGPFNDGSFGNHIARLAPELGVRRAGGGLRSSGGVRWHSGGRFINPSGQGNFYHDTFPVFISKLSKDDVGSEGDENIVEIVLEEEWEGFSFCGLADFSLEEITAYAEGESSTLIVRRPFEPVLTGENMTLFDIYVGDQLLVEGVRWPEINGRVQHILDGEDRILNCCMHR